MNRPIRRVGYAVTVLILLLVGAAHVPAGRRRQAARQRPAQRARTCSGTSPARAVRSSPPTARSSPSRSRPTTSSSTSATTRTATSSRRSSGTSRSSPRRQHRRRERATTTCSPAGTRPPAQRHRRPPARQVAHRQRGALADAAAQPAAKDALGDQQGSVVALDLRPARCSRCTRTRPSTRTRSGPRHRRSCRPRSTLVNAPTTRRCRARTASVPTRIDVQGRDHASRARDRDRHPDDGVPDPRRLPDPRYQHHLDNFGGEIVWRHARARASSIVQHHVRRPRLRARRAVPAGDGRVRHRRAAAHRPRAGRRCEHGPAVAGRPGPVRARRHRAGRRVHHTAADGAGRGRRSPTAARSWSRTSWRRSGTTTARRSSTISRRVERRACRRRPPTIPA